MSSARLWSAIECAYSAAKRCAVRRGRGTWKRRASWGAACLSRETHDSPVDTTHVVDAALANETVPDSGCNSNQHRIQIAANTALKLSQQPLRFFSAQSTLGYVLRIGAAEKVALSTHIAIFRFSRCSLLMPFFMSTVIACLHIEHVHMHRNVAVVASIAFGCLVLPMMLRNIWKKKQDVRCG